jgi:acetyl-CoA acetyltransferase
MGASPQQATITGIGQTEFSRKSGRSEQQLACEAVLAACRDAGINTADIDGMLTFNIDNNDERDVMRGLGVREIRYTMRTPQGGGSSVATLVHAKAAVESGLCDTIVIWRAMNERSQYRFGQPSAGISPHGHSATMVEFCLPFGAQTPAVWEVLSAGPYMHRYGVTTEDLGRVAVLLRAHAAANPNAWFHGKPITLEEHQASRWIVAPYLRLLDCCQETDGGCAIIVTRHDRARDLKQRPVRILGAEYAFLYNHEIISDFYEGDLATLPMAERVTERLASAAGLRPCEAGPALIYDNFTPQVLRQIEGFGFCKRGEAKDYISDGHMALSGKTPLSPNGGLIGEAYVHGLNNITEAVRQVRGTAVNQVNTETSFVGSGIAGAILGR